MQHFKHCGVERCKLTYHDSGTAALRMAVATFEVCKVHHSQSHFLCRPTVRDGPVFLGASCMSLAKSSLRMATDFNLKALLPEASALYCHCTREKAICARLVLLCRDH